MSQAFVEANVLFLQGRFDEVVKLLERSEGHRPHKETSLMASALFYEGRFYEAQLQWIKQRHDPDWGSQAEPPLELLDQYGFNAEDWFLPTAGEYPQSVAKDSDGVDYDECRYGNSLRELPGSDLRRAIAMLRLQAHSSDLQERAQADFDLAEFFFGTGDPMQAYPHYLAAAHAVPQKALYWGFAAQALFRINATSESAEELIEGCLKVSQLARTAQRLDPNNPFWHLLVCHALMTLMLLVSPLFKFSAIRELGAAYTLCTTEQDRLRRSVVDLMQIFENRLGEDLLGNPLTFEIEELQAQHASEDSD